MLPPDQISRSAPCFLALLTNNVYLSLCLSRGLQRGSLFCTYKLALLLIIDLMKLALKGTEYSLFVQGLYYSKQWKLWTTGENSL